VLQFWNCLDCKGYNDGLNRICVYCGLDVEIAAEYITYRYQALLEIERGIYEYRGYLSMAESTEDLFVKFYNHEKILVKDMDVSSLRQHREELSKVAYEAKARLTAADDDLRERKAKDPKAPWLISTNDNPSISDAVGTVKTRQARMSKMDKMRADLLKTLGDEELVDEMIRKMEKRATESTVKSLNFTDKTNKVIEQKTIVVESLQPEQKIVMVETTEKKPFDPSTLKFGK